MTCCESFRGDESSFAKKIKVANGSSKKIANILAKNSLVKETAELAKNGDKTKLAKVSISGCNDLTLINTTYAWFYILYRR